MEVLILLVVLGVFGWWLLSRQHRTTPPTAPTRTRTASRYPRPASRSPIRTSARWVPLGETVTVSGLELPGGFYLGEGLDAVEPILGTEPALINPLLPVDLRRPDLGGQHMGYWPSYSDIPPSSRAAYLRWLEAGRLGGAYIGYVFLFFYGIERRVFRDTATARSEEEIPALLAEVDRLLALYGDNRSFQGYGIDFVSTARLLAAPKQVSDLTPPRTRFGWDIPLDVKLVTGALAAADESIPAEWALAWALTSPDIFPRTPATRCPDEFARLFLIRYADAHGDGLRIEPNKAKLRLEYRPASASFGDAIELDSGGLPDVTRLPGPTKELATLVTAVTDELDAYSRYVGRHDDRDSVRAVALLPPAIARERLSEPALVGAVPAEGHHVVAAADVAAILGAPSPPKLPKRDATVLASFLETHGVGLEPDVRVGTANFSHHGHAVLWREDEASAPAGEGFAAATVLLHLGVTVSASDGQVTAVEEQHLESGLESAFDLPPAGRRRLRAHLRWLLAEQPGIAGVKARLASIDTTQRELIARYLLAVAGADGHVTAKEVDSLRKLYGLLGLDPESVHGDLHDMASSSASSSPTPVVRADPDLGDFALPGEVLLDQRRLAEVMSSTEQVTNVLTAVFVDDEPEETPPEPDSEADGPGAVAGLDSAHASLVRRLAAQPVWPRADFDALAAEVDLLGAGAIEAVNEAAFAVSDGPLLEGDDPIELDGHVLKELLDA